MDSYILSCSSTADLTEEHFSERKLPYICFHYYLDGILYDDNLGKSMSFDEFYRAMANDAEVKTSQINLAEYLDYFSSFLEKGQDVLHVCFSSGLSGARNSAESAALIARERYPDRKLLIVDSLCASSGYGLFMDRLADLRDEGKGIDELYAWAMEHRLQVNHWFFSTDLKHYVKGGRISEAAGFFGGMLGICPLLSMDDEGRLILRGKIRSKRRVIVEIVDRMEKLAQDGVNYSGKCYISNSACHEDASAVAELVEARFPNLNGRVEIYSIGTTIGSHTGPGTVALFFWGASTSREQTS